MVAPLTRERSSRAGAGPDGQCFHDAASAWRAYHCEEVDSPSDTATQSTNMGSLLHAVEIAAASGGMVEERELEEDVPKEDALAPPAVALGSARAASGSAEDLVGRRCSVYWRGDRRSYLGTPTGAPTTSGASMRTDAMICCGGL